MRLDQFAREMARPLGLKGHQKRTELVPSITMEHELRVESPLEGLTARALDIDPRVTLIRPQPFTLRLDLLEVFPTKKEALAAYPPVPRRDEREEPDDVYVYTPDLLAAATASEVVLECKTAQELACLPDTTVEQWSAALAAVGYPFQIIVDTDIDAPGLEENLIRVRDAMRALSVQGPSVLAPLLQVLGSWQGQLTVAALEQTGIQQSTILMGIAGGALGCDLRAGPLGPMTVLWPTHGDLQHLQILTLKF